ncbi:hypothetical protein BC938DRAFT_471887 [Jimgerdemannia flammicorona]|uniref:Tetraspanin family-domain-containing protein n=1 Tax=Jimgerdemannia flammicorona TaxID=994334 RepID=A0A433QUH2_9FUNG|nr:hypothetical protein BC938DRAFT_471887 [Jimgerdemannia flammicorona]
MVMVKQCCYCIPLRIASFLIGLLFAIDGIAQVVIAILHKNPLSMHLTAINPILGWVYIAENALLGVVGLFGILSALVASFALMKWYARAFWVTTAVTLLWETASFVLAYTRSQETIDSCRSQLLNLANTTVIGNVAPVSKNDTEAQTYGEATCEASVKAGLIAIGVILLVGQILQVGRRGLDCGFCSVGGRKEGWGILRYRSRDDYGQCSLRG